jgi:predicted metal-binding membrane protein
MGNGAGSMGMPAWEFLPMWSAMMAAMMLPAVAPVASLYLRTITSNRGYRVLVFVVGYLLAWAAAGIPAYVVLRVVDEIAADSATAMRAVAAIVLAAAGAYQLSPLKAVCLRHCRSPLGQLLHYWNVKGRGRDLKIAVHHAGFCLGCCWALMALFVAFGVMNVWAMVGLAAIVLGEKLLARGELIGRVAGVAFVVLALLIVASPRVAHAVIPATSIPAGAMTDM